MSNNGVETLMRRGRARMAFLCVLAVSASIAASSQEAPSVSPRATFPGAPAGSGPYTTNNDDSCDITVQPAATLLLPYFEADIGRTQFSWDERADTTFAITNASNLPQIVKVQTWTDRGWPLFSYNIYLTGYDVQRVSMREILTTGQLPDGYSGGPAGERSESSNANHLAGATLNCSSPTLVFDEERLRETRRAMTEGDYYTSTGIASDRAFSVSGDANGDGSVTVSDLFYTVNFAYGGGPSGTRIDGNDDGRHSIADAIVLASHLFAGGPEPFGVAAPAVGYVTMDVVADCGAATPLDSSYYSTVLLYDNVLMGDYQITNPDFATGNWASSYEMVHIRAIPEGGTAGSFAPTNLPYTFYDLYAPSPGIDRRQPLPNTFAARFIGASFAGFSTKLLIWREGLRPSSTPANAAVNAAIPVGEVVAFDESTNVEAPWPCEICPVTPVTAAFDAPDDFLLPSVTGTADLGGWYYLNLNNGGPSVSATARTSSQNWVVSLMSAEGRYGTELSAVPLGNGCSPDPGLVNSSTNPVSPAENVNP